MNGPLPVEAGRRHRHAGRGRLRREIVDDLHLEWLILLDEERARLGRRQLGADERVVRGDAGRHPRLDRREIVRGQGAREQEVVVEAVADRRSDPELRAREQLHHRLGHDVRGRVAHRPQLVLGAGIEQLIGGPALGRLEDLVGRPGSLRRSSFASRESQNPSSIDRTRGSLPRSHPPSQAEPARSGVALTGDSRAGSPAAHGWCLGVRSPGFQP